MGKSLLSPEGKQILRIAGEKDESSYEDMRNFCWITYFRLLRDFGSAVAFSQEWKELGDAVTQAQNLAGALDRICVQGFDRPK